MTVLVSDSFNRANSTTTLGTTDSYNGGTAKTWAIDNSGTWGISSNQAYNVGGSGSNAYIDSGVSDGSITATFATVSNYETIIFRYTNATNFIKVNNESGVYKLQKYVNGSNGVYTVIASSSVVPVSGDVVKVTLNGSSITVYVNGTQIMSATDTFNQTATIHGLRASSSTSRYDNFQIENLNTGSTGTSYSGTGTITNQASLSSSETFVSHPTTTYSGSGTVTNQSSLSGSANEVYVARGTIQTQASLSSGDSFVGHSTTAYSASGTISNQVSLTSAETLGHVQASSYPASGTIQNSVSLGSNENFIKMLFYSKSVPLDFEIDSALNFEFTVESSIALNFETQSDLTLNFTI